jgi:hypothetical protein
MASKSLIALSNSSTYDDAEKPREWLKKSLCIAKEFDI